MPVVLRATGVNFDVDAFSSESNFTIASIRRSDSLTGTANRANSRHPRWSGITVDVSNEDFEDLSGQLAESVAFLEANRAEVNRLVGFPGVEEVVLDFGIARRDVAVQSDYFPPKFIQFVGVLGLGIIVSCYAISDDEIESPTYS